MFTNSFPFATGEEFIENEILELAQYYEEIILCPLLYTNPESVARAIPNNVTLVSIEKPSKLQLLFTILSNLILFFSLLVEDVCAENWLEKMFNIRNLYALVMELSDAFYRQQQLSIHHVQALRNSTVFHSFWMNTGALVLSIFQSKHQIKAFSIRTHRYDLYNFASIRGYINFRHVVYRRTSEIITIAEMGRKYLQEYYPQYQNKFKCCYLGVYDHGINLIPTEEAYHVVSCSTLTAVKRVEWIIDVLSKCTVPIHWTHFGDGVLRGTLEAYAHQVLKNSISYEFKGHIGNKELIDYYQKNAVDVFIHLSASEGLPVSMMEVQSFGIPIIATDVGGVSEIVNQKTGILISNAVETDKIVCQLSHFLDSGISRDLMYRKRVKQFFERNFNAKLNYYKLKLILNK